MKTHLSMVGMLFGTAFFAFSLTPSLLPRTFALQGIFSGLSFAAGYGVGVACLALWYHLQLPEPARPTARHIRNLALAIVISMLLVSLWQAASWQDSIRALMGMEESPGIQPILILLVAVLVFFAVLVPVRMFRWLFFILSARLERHAPPPGFPDF